MGKIHLLNKTWKVFTEIEKSLATSGVVIEDLIATIPSGEEFWGVYDAMGDLTDMKVGTELYFLKGDCRIADNYRKVIFHFPSTDKQSFNEAWLNILLGCMGESVDFTDQVRGVLFSCRQDYKVTVFLSRSCDGDVPKEVAQSMKYTFDINPNVKISYSNTKGIGLVNL
ncbi:hypothetical protein EIN_430800 [Entamoeba invadens IP1]|uniref:Uncharacterized protein n=1 Tax=Entamoeba invadens IP1 TaxID=370355 RepID=A0A0A1UGY5_ENTIV|nr:hypothetical protein EIN_430800 [Entamoeba invadens IP1]ELP95274.1 hypothetical protein EIN_430800 [Entamoeba invadens IP1]|eukprot:XP_004262045.1 hypothetical protein EIN_430800 [Entamoeba invadens IP1]